MQKIEFEGWLKICYEDTGLYPDSSMSRFDYDRLNDLLKPFNGKKIKIIVECMEEE